MLLKDCPVGSVVRLVSFEGRSASHPWWQGNFMVEKGISGNFVTDGDGEKRSYLYNDPDYQFKIVKPAPESLITFTVCGQEFYVGQRVWSLEYGGILKKGEEIEILGIMPDSDYHVTVRKIGTSQVCQGDVDLLSTTPPATHEWKRGDWARHDTHGDGFVCHVNASGSLMISFDGLATTLFNRKDVDFIGHTELTKQGDK